MARLRKASPLEPSIFLQPQDQSRPRRSSPRKAVREVSYTVSSDEDGENIPLRPKASKRDLGDPSSNPHINPPCTSESRTSPGELPLTPRRQRILRPVESNSRLLRRLSDESLASPEKRPGSERRAGRDRSEVSKAALDLERSRNFLYAKNLVRSVARRDWKKSSSRIDTLDHSEQDQWKSMQEKTVAAKYQETEAEPEEETSILCGDEADVAQELEEQQIETDAVEQSTPEEEQEENEEKEDFVLRVRPTQRRTYRRIVSDSESEVEEQDTTHGSHELEAKQADTLQSSVSTPQPHRQGQSSDSNCPHEVIDLTDSPKTTGSFVLPDSTRVRSSSFAASRPVTSSSEGTHPFLTYSPTPTKRRSPCKAPPASRPITPPIVPPSPTKLISPSKKKNLIPRVPDLRPSLEAFWNPEVVNGWHDRHSPEKKLVSPKKQQWREDISKMVGGLDLEGASSSDAEYTRPAANTRKKTSRSQPTQTESVVRLGHSIKDVRAQRQAFIERRHDIAISFLAELDNTICSGRIAKMSEATGGIKLVWSKTLKTTAGRANWRREVIRLKTSSSSSSSSSSSPPTYTTETRHHCSIELASKVIDDSSRLYNVLAHEFCHLLTFMISEVRNNPHGAEFKAWGSEVSAAFAEKGVEVTTKHSYAIDYKFVWECVSCGYEFKRHSRSVDTKRHSCGKCKGRLVQTKPAPRNAGVGKDGEDTKKSRYNVYVKENFKRVKEDMSSQGLDTQMGKVMEIVAKQYREKKKEEERASENTANKLHAAFKDLKL